MKALSLLCVVSSLLLSLTACSSKEAPAADEGAASPGLAMSASQVYQRRCASCHGATGKGDGPLARNYPQVGDLSSARVQSAHTDEELQHIMTNGFRRMPPVRALSQPEIDRIIEHVRSLAVEPTE